MIEEAKNELLDVAHPERHPRHGRGCVGYPNAEWDSGREVLETKWLKMRRAVPENSFGESALW